MSDIPQLIYDTYMSFYPSWLASDIIVIFIGKLLVIFSVLLIFYLAFFAPIIFIINAFRKTKHIKM